MDRHIHFTSLANFRDLGGYFDAYVTDALGLDARSLRETLRKGLLEPAD
ncbi:hypothetical protein ABZZ79_31375 [Streptomyces sp. NPDC006458]